MRLWPVFQEKVIKGLSGWLMLVVLVALVVLSIVLFANAVTGTSSAPIVLAVILFVVACGGFAGLTVVNPNEAKVVILFGTYQGSVKEPGLWWFNPLTRRRSVSLRIRN